MQRFIAPWTLAVVFALASSAAAQKPAEKPAYMLKVVTDRPDAIYKVGEKATFTITLTKQSRPLPTVDLKYNLSNDGFPPLTNGELASSTEPATLSGTLEKPGFLRLRVYCKSDGQQLITAQATAAFDPLQIKPSLPVPDDFDAFWNEQKRQLAAVPMKPRLTPVASKAPEIEAFDVQVDCLGGKPVSGYFARPKGAQPKSLPAELFVHGAGVRSSVLPVAINEARRGRLAMDMNAHGIANGQPQAFYDALSTGELKDYRLAGRESRDTCYFRGMFLRLVRGLDFLCSQPEWDGKTVIVRGASQGGGQALAAAGLDPRVTAFFAGVPALCDHSGNVAGRVAGWPKLVPLGANGQPDEKVLQVARYFDGMNFATRARADAIVSVGFIDGTCPPSSVYAAYNNLPGRKQIVTGPLAGHEVTSDATKAVEAFVNEHIADMQRAE